MTARSILVVVYVVVAVSAWLTIGLVGARADERRRREREVLALLAALPSAVRAFMAVVEKFAETLRAGFEAISRFVDELEQG